MENHTLTIFRPVFENQLSLGKNEVCGECDAIFKNPLLPWIVGGKYRDTQERLLFVGKPHRGNSGHIFPSGLLDPIEPYLDWLMSCSWPYWRYTRDIVINIYGDLDPWDYIAFTNIIKCTNVGDGDTSTDKTSYKMAECCIQKLGVVSHEIRLLMPRTIIFYTYALFREFLRNLPETLGASSSYEVTPETHRVPCGQKWLGWWERRLSTPWSDNVRALVVGHPERMKRDEYVGLLTNWIKS